MLRCPRCQTVCWNPRAHIRRRRARRTIRAYERYWNLFGVCVDNHGNTHGHGGSCLPMIMLSPRFHSAASRGDVGCDTSQSALTAAVIAIDRILHRRLLHDLDDGRVDRPIRVRVALCVGDEERGGCKRDAKVQQSTKDGRERDLCVVMHTDNGWAERNALAVLAEAVHEVHTQLRQRARTEFTSKTSGSLGLRTEITSGGRAKRNMKRTFETETMRESTRSSVRSRQAKPGGCSCDCESGCGIHLVLRCSSICAGVRRATAFVWAVP
eukprot:6699880-Prymnesium_polylepis.2